jgi:4-carboxymuconolactone decarboxylase
MLVTIAVGSALQRIAQLRTYLDSALNMGIPLREIEEVLLQTTVLAGFPAAVNAFEALGEAFEERGDDIQPGSSPDPGTMDDALVQLDSAGEALLIELFGEGQPPSDQLDRLETRFVFGQLYRRPGLDLTTRALCTLAALCALGWIDELARWAVAAKRLGLSPESIDEVLLQCACYAGFPAARAGRAVLGAGQLPG